MPHPKTPSPDELQRAISMIREIRPAYGEIIDFHGKVAIAQVESEHRIEPESIPLNTDHLPMKMKEGFPLISKSRFVIDSTASESLLLQLCEIARQSNPTMADSAKTILQALENKKTSMDTLFDHLACEASPPMEKISGDLGTDAGILSFLVYNSVVPSLQRCVEQILSAVPDDVKWSRKGSCPICGSAPGMAALESNGKRFLICHYCRHEWTMPRLCCPFCENDNQQAMKYFYSDEEPEYRVDTCDKCNSYLKTLDTRQTSRILHFPLEQTATLHLDWSAQEKGFRQPVYRV